MLIKVQDLEIKEKELNVMKEIKPEYEKAKTRISTLENELVKLKEIIVELTKTKDSLKEEIENEREEKNEVIYEIIIV